MSLRTRFRSSLAAPVLVFGWAAIVWIAAAVAADAQAPPRPSDGTAAAIHAAMEAPERPAADRARDRNRKPVETLGFFRLRRDMKVLELVPGGGWYTRILAPVLRDEGELAVSMFPGGAIDALPDAPGYDRVRVVDEGLDAARIFGQARVNRRLGLPPFSFSDGGFDLVLTFRNLHNFTEEGRRHMHAAVFAALAPGGLYGVVDHTRRHMAPDHAEVWRRMDPVEMILEIESAGFAFVDWSDLHYRPDDELRYEVGRRTVTGNTDRFTFLFRKPENGKDR